MKTFSLIAIIFSALIIFGCKKDDTEVKPCDVNSSTIPVLIENTTFAEKERGYSALGIEKGAYDAFVVTTSSTSPYYPNFESSTTRYQLNDDPNGEIFADGEFNGKEYWFIHADFESSDASINYSVYLECDNVETEEKGTSQTSDLTIYSPKLCDLMSTYSLWETIYDGIPASQSTVKIRLVMNELNETQLLQNFISEDGITLRATTTFEGVKEPSKEIKFADKTNINTELSLNLFELTGYSQSAWPDSHNAKGSIVNINLELKVCGNWYPIGIVLWQTLG